MSGACRVVGGGCEENGRESRKGEDGWKREEVMNR